MFKEKRSSFRCPIQTNAGPALLKIGSKEYVVQLVEESAGGFGVVAEQAPKLKEGQEALLATTSGRCEVAVTHITEVGEKTRIGLSRLADLDDNYQSRLFGWLPFRSTMSRGRGFAALLLFGICVGFFFWGAAFPSAWWRNVALGGPEFTQTSERIESSQDQREQSFLQNYRLLNDLTSKEFAESLKLNSGQKTQIDSIVHRTTKTLKTLYDSRRSSNDEKWIDAGISHVTSAWLEVQEILTDEQKARWKQLLQS